MSKIESIKNHIRKHKKAYVIGGTVAAVGVAAGVGYILRVRSVPQSVETSVNVRPIQVLAYKSKQTVRVYVETLGDPGDIIQDLTTGTIYASQGQAARALGVDPARISEHLQGKLPNVQGHKLSILVKAAVLESA